MHTITCGGAAATRFSLSGIRGSFSQLSSTPAGSINLAGSTMELVPDLAAAGSVLLTPQGTEHDGGGGCGPTTAKKVTYAFSFLLRTADGTVYPLRCASSEDRAAWMQAIQAAAVAAKSASSARSHASSGFMGSFTMSRPPSNSTRSSASTAAASSSVAAATLGLPTAASGVRRSGRSAR